MSKYYVFSAVGLVLFLAAVASSTITVAFPILTSSFNTSLVTAGWVLSIYQLVATAAMVVVGKASDALGRKFVFLLCLGLFTAGSLLCAIAPNIQSLIVFRALQAIGGGGFLPSAVGIVSDQFPLSRQRAIGLTMSIFPVGMIVGPNLGGWLVSAYGWRSIFWVNIPLAVTAGVFLFRLLKQPQQREKAHVDLAGAGLFTVSLFSLMLGIAEIEDANNLLTWIIIGVLLLVSVIAMIVFLRRESRIEEPIIDLVVLRKKPFVAANVYNFIFGAAVFGFFSFIPLYAVEVYGMSTLQSGLILTPRSIGMIVTSTIGSMFLIRWGYRWPMLIGTIGIAASLFLMGAEPMSMNMMQTQLSAFTIVSLIVLLSGLAMGITSPAASNACIDLMPDRVATITGVRGMFRQSGGALSITVISLVLHYTGDMAHGFFIIFVCLGLVMLLVIPFIFAMPAKAQEITTKHDSGEARGKAVH
jgi:EmrB/QacA subfamily drug resistance transporter